MRSLVVAFVMLLGGCDLYFGGGDDDCGEFVGDLKPDIIAADYRNPDTGQCEYFGGGGYCNDRCGPCPQYDQPPLPDWGSCYSACEGLDENSCIGTAGCYASYLDPIRVPPEQDITKFQGCWAIAPSGPAPGACSGLDAYACSRHDNCSAVYSELLGPDDQSIGMQFASCIPEQGNSCGGIDCGPGSHCEEQCTTCDPTTGMDCEKCGPVCVPDGDLCELIDCVEGYECVQVCDGMDPNNPGCGVCRAECVPSTACEALPTEAQCGARGDCARVYEGENCTCDANGNCDCEILTYERCETR